MMSNLNIELSDEILSGLAAFQAETGLTQDEVITECLTAYLKPWFSVSPEEFPLNADLSTKQARFLRTLVKETTLTKALGVLSMSPTTPYRWAAEGSVFAQEWERAKEAAARQRLRNRASQLLARSSGTVEDST
jgi:hypothetical protein